MSPTRSDPELAGVFGLVGRLVAPAEITTGRLTTLLGVLWLTGGAWLLVGWLLEVYDQGWSPGILGVALAAVAIGASLVTLRQRQLGTAWNLLLTLLGSSAIALATLWAGPRGVGVTGVLFVYVTCFTAIALPRQAVVIVVVSAGMHLGALVAGGYDAAVGVWLFVWGTAVVTGGVVGAAFLWLRQLVGRLEEADAFKTRFVATVSHELRTPLTAILGFSETLEREWGRLDDTDRRRFLGIIDRQAKRQLRLVEDVLTMSTLSRGTANVVSEPVDVGELTARVVESAPFGIEVVIDEPVVAKADRGHLEQVLENLLVNADRYGAPPLLVRATAVGEQVHIDVVDHGEGMVDGLGGDLLEAFVQGDDGDRRSSRGVGLGLTVCRDLLALNGGALTYRHTHGGGATLRVTLPAG